MIGSIEQYIEKTTRLISDEENLLKNVKRKDMTKEQREDLNRRLMDKCIYYIDESWPDEKR